MKRRSFLVCVAILGLPIPLLIAQDAVKRRDLDLWGIQIRRSLTDVEARPTKFASTTPPAEFSYQRDFDKGSDVWTAKGIVARPFAPFGPKDVGSSIIIPSIEFDRLSNRDDPAQERDVLIFRIGAEIGLPAIVEGYTDDGSPLKAGNRLRLNVAHKTDFGFESQAWAGEVEWETSFGPLGGYHPVPSLGIAWFPQAYLRAEFGTRGDHRETLSEDEKDFFRYGPVLQVAITPWQELDGYWKNRFTVTVGYTFLASAKADRNVSNLFARLDWNIDKEGHLKLGIEYRNGAPTLEEDRVKTLTISLGVAL